MSPSGALIGVDLGSHKTGLAVALEGISLPRAIVPTTQALAAIKNLAQEIGASEIVVGMPDDCYPKRQQATKKFIADLQSYLIKTSADSPTQAFKIHTIDEGCTTFEADAEATQDPTYGGKKPARDAEAAAAILRRRLNLR